MIQGVYYNGYDFFRFYKDGNFIHCLIRTDNPKEETFKQILEWFDIGSSSVQKGSYKYKNGSIEFSIAKPFGERSIDYSGKASGKNLVFETLNHNSGKKTKATYIVVPIPRKK